MTLDAEVAVVGYGPVGNTLAILLAQLGRSVVVLERRPEPYPLPRAVHFDNEVGRILQSCGIGEELRSITEPVRHLRVAKRQRDKAAPLRARRAQPLRVAAVVDVQPAGA